MSFLFHTVIFFKIKRYFITFFYLDLEKETDGFCGHGWTAFGEEKCFKAFCPMLNFVDAQSFCASRSVGGCLRAHLATVTSKEEHSFLLNFLSSQEKFENESFWLGAERKGSAKQQSFKWVSNQEELNQSDFTNWAPGNPKPKTDSLNYCLQMTVNSTGLWFDEPCTERKHVLCERPSQWMLEKMQKTLTKLEKVYAKNSATTFVATSGLEDSGKAVVAANFAAKEATKAATAATFAAASAEKAAADAAKAAVDSAKSAIPIGFIYVQLPGEAAPEDIFHVSKFKWTDISETYKGVFFRVVGNGSAPFGAGVVQTQAAPHLDQVVNRWCYIGKNYGCDFHDHHDSVSKEVREAIKLNESGWADFPVWLSRRNIVEMGNRTGEYLEFHNSGGEVRPRNVAVKVWKRTG